MYNLTNMQLHRMRKAGLPHIKIDRQTFVYHMDAVQFWISERYEVRGIYYFNASDTQNCAVLSDKNEGDK